MKPSVQGVRISKDGGTVYINIFELIENAFEWGKGELTTKVARDKQRKCN